MKRRSFIGSLVAIAGVAAVSRDIKAIDTPKRESDRPKPKTLMGCVPVDDREKRAGEQLGEEWTILGYRNLSAYSLLQILEADLQWRIFSGSISWCMRDRAGMCDQVVKPSIAYPLRFQDINSTPIEPVFSVATTHGFEAIPNPEWMRAPWEAHMLVISGKIEESLYSIRRFENYAAVRWCPNGVNTAVFIQERNVSAARD